jgi:DNA polymerase III sliding clamp (beta) subunit (PCNA family)
VPVAKPTTALLAPVAALIKDLSEVHLRCGDLRLELMPDAWTQTSSLVIETPYPNVASLVDRFTADKSITIDAQSLIAAIDRVLVLVKSERYPLTTLTIEDGSLGLVTDIPDVGKIADVIPVAGDESKFTMLFDPAMLRSAVEASGAQIVHLDYGQQLHPVRLRDDDGYVVLMMPRRNINEGDEQ